ncbi:hypothetical protein FQA39_LY16737 [Lamprigera yunnana]|nr:hypothetical protein FQA39_LY16737 [Lamprigera yunnana]
MPIQLCPLHLQNLMTWKLQRRLISERIEPQAVPDSYTTNVDDSPYVEEPFQDSGSSYAPSEEYGRDSTSDAMEKASDEEQESSRVINNATVHAMLSLGAVQLEFSDYYW